MNMDKMQLRRWNLYMLFISGLMTRLCLYFLYIFLPSKQKVKVDLEMSLLDMISVC